MVVICAAWSVLMEQFQNIPSRKAIQALKAAGSPENSRKTGAGNAAAHGPRSRSK
jgi:hypothetical protein